MIRYLSTLLRRIFHVFWTPTLRGRYERRCRRCKKVFHQQERLTELHFYDATGLWCEGYLIGLQLDPEGKRNFCSYDCFYP